MQDVSQEKYRQLQTAPMGKLVLQYSIPAIINLAAVSLYNLIDSIFIGNGVGTLAISGLAVTFPMMNCLIAFNTLVGIGVIIFYLINRNMPDGILSCYESHSLQSTA